MDYHCPRFDELPDLYLYMDQLLVVVTDALRPCMPTQDIIVTATMVNNYVKQKIVPPSRKKKYDREHVARLIMISSLKLVLSIPEINWLFEVLDIEQDPKKTYDLFCDELERCLADDSTLPSKDAASPALLGQALRALSGKLGFLQLVETARGDIA